ncbi:unnamed protein product, partial [Arabidopsis halleri]
MGGDSVKNSSKSCGLKVEVGRAAKRLRFSERLADKSVLS